MNAKTLIAAAALFTAASASFAADNASATTAAPAASAAAVSVAAQSLNVPVVSIPAGRTRAEVNAEAVDFVIHYKTTLATQLELADNVAH
jgi:hypothetical protein